VVEKEDPTLFLAFEPRQDFTLFYSLFDRIEDPCRVWEDRLRGTNDVIRFERNETTSSIRIAKNYILDYLFVRKKALLIGSYFLIVAPADSDVPKEFRKESKYETGNTKAKINVAKDNISGENVIVQLDLVKALLPPKQRLLGDFGVLPAAPKVVFKTTKGEVDMQSYDLGHDVGDFLSIVFFSSTVLKKYEGDSRYRIDDNGGVHYRGVWGIFRGIWRLGDEVIAAHLGDVAEGLPYDEWSHWAAYNVDPLSSEESKELQKIRPIPGLVNDLFSALRSFNQKQIGFLESRRIAGPEAIFKDVDESQKSSLCLKRTFTQTITKDEFLNRTVDLYKLVIDNLNLRLLQRVIDSYSPDYKLDEQGIPLGSLKLLLIYLKLRKIELSCAEFGFKGNLNTKVTAYYDLLMKPDVVTDGDTLLCEIEKEIVELETAFSVLLTLYAFRSKSGGAHPKSQEEFAKAMIALGLKPDETNYLPAYRKLIKQISELFFCV
jgi:hypothetical protein